MVEEAMRVIVGCINERIRFEGNDRKMVNIAQYYTFLGKSLFFNCTGLSLSVSLCLEIIFVIPQRMGLQPHPFSIL